MSRKVKRRRRLLGLFSLVVALFILGTFVTKEEPIDVVASERENPYYFQDHESKLKDGVYRAKGNGFIDEIEVEMVVDQGTIISFRVIGHNETSQISKTALSTIPYQIEKDKTLKVDIVSGATETSNGIIQGARAVIRQAGGNPEDY